MVKMIIGIDAGGTFTDFVVVGFEPTLTVRIHKVLSTPEAPEKAIFQGIKDLELETFIVEGSARIVHGSTVATNAVLEGKGAATAFVTNHGFRDLLQLGRQDRPKLYALEFEPQRIKVPRERCLELPGRVASDGTIIQSISSSEIDEFVLKVAEQNVEAVAINFLFSFLNGDQEKQVEYELKQRLPFLKVSCSHQVLPESGEYERGIATWLNASLAPLIDSYLKALDVGLRDADLQVMQSSAETIGAAQAGDNAVKLLLSGPAGGLTGLKFLGKKISHEFFISFDMGGTSTDVALIDGELAITNESKIADLPIKVPMVDMHTIGAGGGSVAYVDEGGMLQVGPRSAGALPGPICYDRGGTEITVTDAHLVLNRLPDSETLPGGLKLNRSRAEAAMERLGRSLGLCVKETATGIIAVANDQLAAAIRLISVNKGHNPENFLLASFGGAGGLHVCALAGLMNMSRAIVPVFSGVFSALGMTTAKRGRQFSKTVNMELHSLDLERLLREFLELESIGRAELSKEGLTEKSLRVARSVDLCFSGQSYNLTVAWKDRFQAQVDFESLHMRRYGYCHKAPIDVVNIRVSVATDEIKFDLPERHETESEFTEKLGSPDSTGHLRVDDMELNKSINGPQVLVAYGTTIFVEDGWVAYLDKIGNIHLKTGRIPEAL